MTRAKAARILRHWRTSARLGRGQLSRVRQDGVRAYLFLWVSDECSGMYVQTEPAGRTAPRVEIDTSDPFARETYFNLEPV